MRYCDHLPSVIVVVVVVGVIVVHLSVRPQSLNNISSLTTDWILTKLHRNDPWLVLFQNGQMIPVHCISGSQELKIDFLTKNLKNLLVRNYWTDFNIILKKCSFNDPLPRLFKPLGFIKKHGRQGRGLFSLYIDIGSR